MVQITYGNHYNVKDTNQNHPGTSHVLILILICFSLLPIKHFSLLATALPSYKKSYSLTFSKPEFSHYNDNPSKRDSPFPTNHGLIRWSILNSENDKTFQKTILFQVIRIIFQTAIKIWKYELHLAAKEIAKLPWRSNYKPPPPG